MMIVMFRNDQQTQASVTLTSHDTYSMEPHLWQVLMEEAKAKAKAKAKEREEENLPLKFPPTRHHARLVVGTLL